MTEYTATELENSAPFDPNKRLRGDAGSRLQAEVRDHIYHWEEANGSRTRTRKAKDEASLEHSLDVFLANLVSLWLNRVDNTRYLAVSFNKNDYKAPLSLAAMTTARDALEARELIDVAHGFIKLDQYEIGKRFSRRTRIRPTETLLQLFEDCGIERTSLRIMPPASPLVLRRRETDMPPPPEVEASVATLDAINAQISAAEITLPDDAWARISTARQNGDDPDAYRAFAGDTTAKVLRRIFSRTWDQGGRIYGGWWMHVPKGERQHILIDGEPVVEWDYASLHPALLFARTSTPLDFDPYTLPGIDSPNVRLLGKRTFQRLINRTDDKPMRAANGDGDLLPPRMSFKEYLNLFRQRLAPIAEWIGTGEGLRLQRKDSDLAIQVLGRMVDASIVALPIHDSFLVQERHSDTLREAMEESYKNTYLSKPIVRKVKALGSQTS